MQGQLAGSEECETVPPAEASLKLLSDFYPVNSRGKILDTFQKNIEKELTRSALRSGSRGQMSNDNLSSEEHIALESLSCDSTIVNKSSDKGGLVVSKDGYIMTLCPVYIGNQTLGMPCSVLTQDTLIMSLAVYPWDSL